MDNVIKVVICEDHEIFRKGVIYSLSHKEDICFIGEADNGMKLMQLLKHCTPDIILLDINMPIMDGKACLLKLKKDYPDIKVIMLTMRDEMSTILDMMKNGADAYLVKNCGEGKIYEAIVSCYKTGKYFDDNVSRILLSKVQGKIIEKENKITEDKTHKEQPEVVKKFDYIKVFQMTVITAAIGTILILIFYIYKSTQGLNIHKNIIF